uniref:3-dehydrosphinganine reductase TSC10B n=1 Tax=Noccaea caerulescens TaxID=107243 RepID=A0A1J3HDL9_NOCCA
MIWISITDLGSFHNKSNPRKTQSFTFRVFWLHSHKSTCITNWSATIMEAGIYGYTAYSASKCGLQGLAQALQQEVISDDIHVTLLFPPDTDTPGFEQEQKKRPELTSIIAASSGSMKTKEVAKICLDGIKAGKFTVTCHFIGFLLSIASSGMSPQRSFWLAFVQVMFGGLIRLVGLFFQWDWYKTIEKWSKTKKRGSK